MTIGDLTAYPTFEQTFLAFYFSVIEDARAQAKADGEEKEERRYAHAVSESVTGARGLDLFSRKSNWPRPAVIC